MNMPPTSNQFMNNPYGNMPTTGTSTPPTAASASNGTYASAAAATTMNTNTHQNNINAAQPPPPPAGSGLNWRTQLTRDQRQELIFKIYNELIRATGEAPGASVWMKASNYELKLYHDSQERNAYLTKISRRLYLLAQRPTLLNPLMLQVQQMQHQQTQQQTQQHVGMMQPSVGQDNPLLAGMSTTTSMGMTLLGNNTSAGTTNESYLGMPASRPNVGFSPSATVLVPPSGPVSVSSAIPSGPLTMTAPITGELADQYWTKHSDLKTKYYEDCVLVYRAFRRYVESGRPEDEQTKKLTNLLHYVHQVVIFLGEDPLKNPAKPLTEVDKADAYIKKIVLPYLNKLKTEKERKNSISSSRTSIPASSQNQNNTSSGLPSGGIDSTTTTTSSSSEHSAAQLASTDMFFSNTPPSSSASDSGMGIFFGFGLGDASPVLNQPSEAKNSNASTTLSTSLGETSAPALNLETDKTSTNATSHSSTGEKLMSFVDGF